MVRHAQRERLRQVRQRGHGLNWISWVLVAAWVATAWLAQYYRNQRDDLALFVVTVGLITEADVEEYVNRKNNK